MPTVSQSLFLRQTYPPANSTTLDRSTERKCPAASGAQGFSLMSNLSQFPKTLNSNPRKIVISDWKPLDKNTLRGSFTAALPSGMIIKGLMLMESHGKRWIGLPAKEWLDPFNKRNFSQIIEFVDGETRDKFQHLVLTALDAHLEGGR
jgi:hypothetical protein